MYRIDSERCIKIFKRKRVCKDEFETLFIAQADIHFPKLYYAGEDYIVRECINGIELNKYLLNHSFEPWISAGIIGIYEAMKKVDFTRLDSTLFHVFVTSENSFKLIDTSKALRKKTEYPGLILRGLNKLGCKEEFLDFVKYAKPDLYIKWTEYPG